MKELKVQIVDYNLYEYEKNFLAKEIKKLGGNLENKIERNKIVTVSNLSLDDAKKLTYIKGLYKDKLLPSLQSIRESFNGKTPRVQSRRYGPHGLHEYKGRFNPQTPRSLILSNFNQGDIILDPFMGSGTTLVEARDLNFKAVGVELNQFAFLLAKAKKIYEEIPSLGEIKWSRNLNSKAFFDETTRNYLLKWFPEREFRQIEFIQNHLQQLNDKQKVIAQVILSNLLREHSLQDPNDLRIRRREAIPADSNLLEAFKASFSEISEKHKGWIKEFGVRKSTETKIFNHDSRYLKKAYNQKVGGTVSSPPYATALPYIDTYRLSMVALGLIHPKEILKKEKELIGSRDVNALDESIFEDLISNLPGKVKKTINHIHQAIKLDPEAGFRKKATPHALARYFSSMLKVLEELHSIEQAGSKNFWVLGPNRIKLGSDWFSIETPELIGELAKAVGFKKVSVEPVQAYNRYGIHAKNAIHKESILSFQKES